MDTSLINKLYIRQKQQGLILNSPDALLESFEGLDFRTRPEPSLQADFFIAFTHNLNDLQSLLPVARKQLKPEGRLWIAYPKKSGDLDSDLDRDKISTVVDQAGLYPNRMVSMNENWSMMSLADKKKQQKDSTFGQDPPGVDRVSKTVIPPEDLKKAFRQSPEAEAFFNTLAFSHKREYVGWIHDAKKVETRKRRICKTIELLSAGKKSK